MGIVVFLIWMLIFPIASSLNVWVMGKSGIALDSEGMKSYNRQGLVIYIVVSIFLAIYACLH